MEETYTTKAIILNRDSFRENDSKVIVYSKERGLLELVARGTKKILSKMAGHLEPISQCDLMVVKGRQIDYVGSVAMTAGYPNIKNDFDKITAAGIVLKISCKIIKPGITDQEIFNLLVDWFDNLENSQANNYNLLAYFFVFKLIAHLGYKPELLHCTICHNKIKPGNNKFSLSGGGLVCSACKHKARNGLTISDNSIKILRILEKETFPRLTKLRIDQRLTGELANIISSFCNYHF